MKQIDFTPLTERRSLIQSIRQIHEYSKAWQLGYGILVLCGSIGVILLVVGLVLLVTGHQNISGFFWMGGFFIICGLAGLGDMAKEFLKNSRLADFAKVNGFIFGRDTLGDDSYHGTYFRNRFVRIAAMIRTPGKQFFEVGNFRIVGRQERSSSGPTYGYIRMKLPRRLPNMMLASKVAKQDLPLPGAIDPSQRLSLEGDFNHVFTLYAPKQYERDALYVFTPDVMAKFMDLFGNFNSEIIDDEIYFFSSRKLDLLKPAVFTELLQTITEFSKKFDHQVDYYSDERGTVGSPRTATNTVADAGRHLKTSPLLRALYVVCSLVIVALMVFGAYTLIRNSTHGDNGPLFRTLASSLITIVIVVAVGAVARWWARHHRG